MGCELISVGRTCISAQKKVVLDPGLTLILPADVNRIRLILIPETNSGAPSTLFAGTPDGTQDTKSAGEALDLLNTTILRIEDWGPVLTDAWEVSYLGTGNTSLLVIELISTFCPVPG